MTPHDLFCLFWDGEPAAFETMNTSHGDSDFREVLIFELASGEKRVIKLAANDFTFPEKIQMWQRTIEEYRSLGYYCPSIFADKSGRFPTLCYQGHECVAYAEEFACFQPARQRDRDDSLADDAYWDDAWIMTAKMAAKKLDYTAYPSAYCMFERFCPSDLMDEVLEDALSWKEFADTLPDEVQQQVQRIWQLWITNRQKLEKVYSKLPTSVFQADLNPTNLLLDREGNFVGICDFNLCGREVFLNYLFREVFMTDFAQELERIFHVLRVVRPYYCFSKEEKETALMLYRCLKPLWFNKLLRLKELGSDVESLRAYLTETEHYLTESIDFGQWMN